RPGTQRSGPTPAASSDRRLCCRRARSGRGQVRRTRWRGPLRATDPCHPRRSRPHARCLHPGGTMPPDPVRRVWIAPRAGGAMADRGRAACPPQLVGGDLHPRLQEVRGERLPAVDQPAPASPHIRGPYARLADPAAAARSGIAGGAGGELSFDPGRPAAT
ncbi:hypothetical protein KXW38_001340, partial [Aspergillus fumigatus]